jgi:putative ABC transport system substrate-binding protein
MLRFGALQPDRINLRINCRRAATYVDKVLRGAKPADLSVEQPTKFDLLFNRSDDPKPVLTRANKVIKYFRFSIERTKRGSETWDETSRIF